MKKIFATIILVLNSVSIFAQLSHKTENIFIITFDGLRWQELFSGADSTLMLDKTYVRDPLALKNSFWADSPEERRRILMPFFWTSIARQGQLYGNRVYENKVNCSNKMWFSYPGYNEILCGYADDARIKSNNKIDNPNVTVLEFLNKQQALSGKVAAFGSWDVFPFIINEERSGIPVNAGFENASGQKLSERELFLNKLQAEIPSPWSGVRLDAFTHHYALEFLKKHQPKVVFISYGETDDFAHDGKYDAYLTSARRTDQFIQELWQWAETQPAYKGKTTFLITTDHGRGTVPRDSWKSHGTNIAGSDQIWFAVIGPDTEPVGEVKSPAQLYQGQIARTAARMLGYDYNTKGAGKAVDAMFGRSK